MRGRVFIGFLVVLELALIAGPRWSRAASAPDGYTVHGEAGGMRLAAPQSWQPVPEAMQQLQLALIGDEAGGIARRLSVAHPVPVMGMNTEQFLEAVRQVAGQQQVGGATVLRDGPVLVRGARAAYRRDLLISSDQAPGGAATFRFSQVWVLRRDDTVQEVQLFVQEPALGDPSSDILRSLQV